MRVLSQVAHPLVLALLPWGTTARKVTTRQANNGSSSCYCGSNEFLTLPHTNLSQSEPADACFSYRLLDARGTAEPQGVSMMFQNLITNILANQTVGMSQPVEYPAGVDQNTTSGEQYLIEVINQGLHSCPGQKYALFGYSQGATLMLQALEQMTPEALESIKSVILVGNPYRVPGKLSSVNSTGQPDHRESVGLFTLQAMASNSTVPELSTALDMSGRVLDYCLEHDNVCSFDPACTCQLPADHLSYGLRETVQSTAFEHVVERLSRDI